MIAAGAVLLLGIVVYAIFTFVNPAVATRGDNVSIYYTMLYENGTIISTNLNSTPLEVTVGDPESIPGLSDAIAGMGINQKRTVIIPYDQAYGPYRSDLIRVVNRTGLIANTSFIEGQYFTIHRRTDNAISMVRILNVTPSTVTWDENHPLAGQNLTFTVQVVSLDKGAGVNLVGTPAAAVSPAISASETIGSKN
jgi:peptidylprolyl isomerase